MIRAIAFLTASLFVFSACKSGDKEHRNSPSVLATAPHAGQEADLSQREAELRKARVSHVEYKLKVNLTGDEKSFTGEQKITFDLKDNSQPLRVDFFEGRVSLIKVNGQVVGPEAKARYTINLPATVLKTGANVVEIHFSQDYSRQGQGLHRFTDPETKDPFLYSQFETYDANRFMPCFDQPDLRATLSLTVEAPAKWEVVSTTRERKITKNTNGSRTWEFPKTAPISTYLFSLHAGPYKVWTDKFEDIPLRLFARPSQAKFVRVKEWFTYTKQGLKFFNSYFDYRYPFKKYDQLIVPEFNAGAMENVGAVTFAERFVWKSEPTRDDLRGLAGVILHEMAHMWFGDIVTMKWWNDLWLNESFATFMATLAMAESTQFNEAWLDFFTDDKSWAYWEDSLVTTHPIEGKVNSVKDAFATFDGITYGKGASVLKQLREYITADAFKRGIQTYIKTHAYSNAELKEFISALQTQTPRNLAEWSDRWLRQSGTDKIAAQWSCHEDSKLKSIKLIITPSAGAQFRPQTMDVGLFTWDKNKFALAGKVRADISQSPVELAGNWACPDFVYPNYNDAGFVAVSLDPRSLEFTKKQLTAVNDPLLRAQLWQDLWKMVRSTDLPLKDYVQILKEHFPLENDALILKQVVTTINCRRGIEVSTVLNNWPVKHSEERTKFIAMMEDEYLRRFNKAKAGSDDQREWFDRFVEFARTPKALGQMSSWAKANPINIAKGMPFDVDRKWKVARGLARYQQPIPEQFMMKLKKVDTSDRGRRNALVVESIAPNADVKEKWIKVLTAEKPSVSFAEARTVLHSLFPIEQTSLARRFENDFYSYLNKNARSENEVFVEAAVRSLAPLDCTSDASDRMREFLKNGERFAPTIAKAMKVTLDEDERCQKVRAMSQL